VFHLEEIASPDLEAKYNAAAGLVQALGERFYPIEQEYNSYKVYAHEADCTASRTMDLDVRLSVESSLQLLTPLQHLEALEGLRTSMLDSVELWQKWQALISLLAEMAVSIVLLLFSLYCCSRVDSNGVIFVCGLWLCADRNEERGAARLLAARHEDTRGQSAGLRCHHQERPINLMGFLGLI
jgi:hypothetical protein